MKKTRGQAALEFLSTYGFAFLVILVMIGALSYFGVLSPGRFLPERCLVNAEFSCTEFEIDRTGDSQSVVRFGLQNNLGNSATFDQGTINVSSDFHSTATCLLSNSPSSGYDSEDITAPGGAITYVQCTMTGTFPSAGEKVRINYQGRYTEVGRNFPRSFSGEVFATIQ